MCDSQNFFGYETRRVGGNIHEDYSMLTERDIEKRHKIDKVCGNIKGSVNCTYTFVAGRSTSKLYCKSSEQNQPRPQSLLSYWDGDEKALASAGHMIIKTPSLSGCYKL